MLEAFNNPQGIAIDTHAKRISNRLGLTDNDDPLKIEQDLLKKIPKKEIAKEIGISGQYLGLIEHGKNYPSIEKLKLICEFTGASADYVLFGKDKNIVNDTQDILSDLSTEQLVSACEAIKDIALYIKSK